MYMESKWKFSEIVERDHFPMVFMQEGFDVEAEPQPQPNFIFSTFDKRKNEPILLYHDFWLARYYSAPIDYLDGAITSLVYKPLEVLMLELRPAMPYTRLFSVHHIIGGKDRCCTRGRIWGICCVQARKHASKGIHPGFCNFSDRRHLEVQNRGCQWPHWWSYDLCSFDILQIPLCTKKYYLRVTYFSLESGLERQTRK